MMFCELLCQAEVISDQQAKEIIENLNNGHSLASLLRAQGIMTHADFLLVRKLIPSFLDDGANCEWIIDRIAQLCGRFVQTNRQLCEVAS